MTHADPARGDQRPRREPTGKQTEQTAQTAQTEQTGNGAAEPAAIPAADTDLSTAQIANAGSARPADTTQSPVGTQPGADAQPPADAQSPAGTERAAHAADGDRPAERGVVRSRAGEQEPRAKLLEAEELEGIVGRWRDIQAGFVDEPRRSVKEADALVADLMQRLARMFASEREQLEARWSAGGSVSTEDLRQGLQRYRSFFERLLAA